MIVRKATIGARLLMALMAVVVVLTGAVVAEIRYGGPIFLKYALQDELIGEILPPPLYVVESYLEASLIVNDQGSLDGHIANLSRLEAAYRTRKAYWATAALTVEEKATLALAETHADAFWNAVDHHFLPAIRAHDAATATRVFDQDMAPAYAAQHEAILRLVDQSGRFKAREHAHDNGLVKLALLLVGVLGATLVGAVWWVGRVVRTAITDPLGRTAAAIERLSSGDFATPIEGGERHDELGIMAQAMEVFRHAGLGRARAEADQRAVVGQLSQALNQLAAQNLQVRLATPFPPAYEAVRGDFNTAVEALSDAMAAVRGGADSLTRSISEIRSASEDLARRNEQQAASLEKTSASLSEVSAGVDETARSARNARASTADTQTQASEGRAVVDRAVMAMAAIEQSAQEIRHIINVIDSIAFQTNLLALNAGVEAARAGDSGRGFAVVAGEVRALAKRSAEAAKDITALITNSTVQVGAGVALVSETGAKLTRILTQVADINTLISDIAISTSAQAANLALVSSAVRDVDRVTRQNAAMVEQSAVASSSVATEASRLSELVSHFQVAVVDGPPTGQGLRHLPKERRADPAGSRGNVVDVRGNLALTSVD